MRDEVFRIPAVPKRKDGPRWVEIDGESWLLLVDVLTARNYSAQLAKHTDLLDCIPEDAAECIWVLEPGLTRPGPRWVVSSEGRAAVHDWLAARPIRRRARRTVPPKGSRRIPG